MDYNYTIIKGTVRVWDQPGSPTPNWYLSTLDRNNSKDWEITFHDINGDFLNTAKAAIIS